MNAIDAFMPPIKFDPCAIINWAVQSVLVKNRTDVFKYGPRRAQQVEVHTKTEVRYFTSTDRTSEVYK